MTVPGLFITFEGGEGSGKSTQLKFLAEALEQRGIPHLTTREPGGTTGAESIRKLLVEGEGDAWDPVSETLLFMAARVDHVRKKILPALREGKHVLCDRFADSTLVYQGIAKGLGREFIAFLHEYTLPGIKPDLTFLLDIPPEAGLERAQGRAGAETRFEALGLEFHRAIREGFLALAKEEPARIVIIDAAETPQEVHQKILQSFLRKQGRE